jgi:hypothetical protein
MSRHQSLFGLLLWVFMLASAAAADNSSAPLAVNLSLGAKKWVSRENNNVPLAYGQLPDGSASALKIEWNPSASKYIEVAFNDSLKLPLATQIRVTAKFFAPAGCPVNRFALRLETEAVRFFNTISATNFRQTVISK